MEQPEILLPQELLSTFASINVQAPMVRYSKLPFRQLVSRYNVHITTTPMILAKEFSRSALARASEFTTNDQERGTFWMYDDSTISRLARRELAELDGSYEPRRDGAGVEEEEEEDEMRRKGMRKVRGSLLAQFAASDGGHLADAVELVKPWVDGIDINCGCPQKWAYNEGIGSALLRKPETVRDLIRTTKQRVGWSFPVSIKIRVDDDPTSVPFLSLSHAPIPLDSLSPRLSRQTHTLITTALAAGADILTIHGRTRQQSSTAFPVDLDAIAFGVECARSFNSDIPTIANGDVWSIEEARETRLKTGCRGVMSARGLLANPALFAPSPFTPASALLSFLHLSTSHSLLFPLFHHHMAYMLEVNYLKRKSKRTWFNSLVSTAAVVDYIEEELGLEVSGSGKGGDGGAQMRREERREREWEMEQSRKRDTGMDGEQ